MKKKLAALALMGLLLRLAVQAGGAEPLLRILSPGEALPAVQADDIPAPEPSEGGGPETISLPGGELAPWTSLPPAFPPAEEAQEPKPDASQAPAPLPEPSREIRPTTIAGGLTLRNSTDYSPDLALLLTEGPSQRLPREGYQLLIVHTHGSEAYTPEAPDLYEASDSYRTEDKAYSVIRVGDALAEVLENAGLSVLHDREFYDYPSYTGSYTRSGEAVQAHLREHPEIALVIDLHRDALGSGDVVYKTVAALEGETSSQLMLLCGSDASGLEHPHWEENLKLALGLQAAVNARYPTLARPISLVRERYNQHLTTGSLILEVGSSGNTLQEALTAVRLFGEAVSPLLLSLTEAQ